MEFDRSLLDKEGAPTEEEMREYFIKNDYTTAKSDFDVSKVSQSQAKLYMKAKKFLSKTETVMKKKNDELLDIQTIAGGIETKEPIETEKPIVKENNLETAIPIITEKPIVKKTEKSQPQKKKNFYTVKKGDALVDISRKMYGTIKKVDLIKRANGIVDENKIYIGQKILIP